MHRKSPKYEGVYERLFVAPTVFIGLGRWGNDVCNRLFRDVLVNISPTRSKVVPDGAPASFTDCFSKLAWVREMDCDIPEVAWASNGAIQTWPSSLDSVEPERFTDIEGEDSVVSFWSTPRQCFRSALAAQWKSLSPKFLRLLERVSSTKWQIGCDALGLQVPHDLERTDKWIVVVGSLLKPR